MYLNVLKYCIVAMRMLQETGGLFFMWVDSQFSPLAPL